jgi:DNA-binding beta-propeller fold protein YncE
VRATILPFVTLRRVAVAASVLAAASASAACGFHEPAIQPITVEPLHRVEIKPTTGKSAIMDILDLDQSAQRLYVTDGVALGIDVIDTSTAPGTYLKTIKTGSIPNGVVVAPQIHRVFVGSDASELDVINVDPHSRQADTVVGRIGVKGQGASDLVEYDPADDKVFLTNPDDGIISVFNGHTYKLVHTITGLGLVDQPRYDPRDGMLYVSGAERNSIIKIDPRVDKVVSEAAIPVTCEPHGLAVDPATNMGVIGCNDKDDVRALSWDFNTNRMVRSFDQAGAGDQVIFNSKSKHFYFAASSYSPAEIAIFRSGPQISFLTGVPTSHKSKGVAYDERHRWIYTYDGKHREAAVWGFPDPQAAQPSATAPAGPGVQTIGGE